MMADLDGGEIKECLSNEAKSYLHQMHCFLEVDSTNQFLLQSDTPVQQYQLCVAEFQKKGRGRHGNQWVSSANQNIMMSLSWHFSDFPSGVSSLSLLIGVLVAERLKQSFGLDVKVKWPNDIWLDSKKIAGILLEMKASPQGGCTVVIGLGLNVEQSTDLLENIDACYGWTDLVSHGVDVDRNQLIGGLVSDWIDALLVFQQKGFSFYKEKWEALSFFQNKRVTAVVDDALLYGKVLGVNDDGSLILQCEHQTINLNQSAAQIRLIDE